jgi:hypothetical protein
MLDTRDLQTEREDLQEQVLQSFLENFPHYEDMTDTFEDILFEEEEIQSWKEDWLDEIESITDIEKLEDEVGSEWEYGVTLIEEDDFEDFVEQDLEDCGYIPKDFPTWIEIDWEATANNVRQDYSEVNFRGTTYLFR